MREPLLLPEELDPRLGEDERLEVEILPREPELRLLTVEPLFLLDVEGLLLMLTLPFELLAGPLRITALRLEVEPVVTRLLVPILLFPEL